MTRIIGLLPLLALAANAAAQSIPSSPALPAAHTLPGLATYATPTVIVGNPAVPDNPNAFSAINDNEPDSPFAGVVSVYGALNSSTGYLGSGVAIDRTHILTAAHVVDFAGGVTPEGAVTGDGIADALLPNSRVYLNNIAAPDPIAIDQIQLAPNWHGFRNAAAPEGASSHDDLAILTLHTPLPASVPSYNIYRTPFAGDSAKIILFSGYGGGGDEQNGITQPASFDIKRYGWNVAAVYETDDDNPLNPTAEAFLSDFDPPAADGGPDLTKGGFDNIASLGNDFESTIAPGDSGGPAFIVSDLNNDGFVEADELSIFGLTTFTFDTTDGPWPQFGSAFGGTILSAYTGFIDSVAVPEPTSLSLVLLAAPLLLRRHRALRTS